MVDLAHPIATLAVVSDLHAFSSKENSFGSVLDFSPTQPRSSNPLSDLIDAARTHPIIADTLVCSGDICNRADYGGLKAAWLGLQDLRTALSAETLIATCGNHDLDSRFLSTDPDPDPKGGLLSLLPPFPFSDEALSNKYWAKNYALVALSSGVLVVSLNTSAYHGGLSEEIHHGRISKRTIDSLATELQHTQPAIAHVLLCHHHPLPLNGWGPGVPDNEFMKNGQELLDALSRATNSNWVVIHGHRHHPRLIQAASSRSAAPFVIGAGSLGARVTGVPNQFHLIKLFASDAPDHSSLVGTVETWNWTDTTKWSICSNAGSLPPYCGFGFRGQIRALASEIERLVGSSYVRWKKVREEIPSVDFLMPEDMTTLEGILKSSGITILRAADGRLEQAGK